MTTAPPAPIGRRDLLALAILSLISVGVPLWLAAAAGAIGIPGNDGWVYMRAADTLFRTGSLDMPGHTAASIGQVVTVQPFLWASGGDSWAFTAYGLVLTLIGIVATYLLARRFIGTGAAVLVVLLVEAFPGFARETVAFMTDVPTYALTMLCLLLGVRWLQDGGRRMELVASMAVGLLALSIREFALAAPVAILVAAWARNRADERAWLAIVSSAFVIGVVVVLGAAASIPGRSIPASADLGRLIIIGPAFATLAAVLLPAIALAVGSRMATISAGQVILAAGVVGVGLVVAAPHGALVGNLWLATGLAGDDLLAGARAAVVGDRAWALSEQLAWFAAILLLVLCIAWAQHQLATLRSSMSAASELVQVVRGPTAVLMVFVLAHAGGLLVFVSVAGMLDRYLLPLVPVAAILLLRGRLPSRLGRQDALSHVALAWLAVSALVLAANSFAYDAARWRAGDAMVAMGYDAGAVDAGYEWMGSHASTIGNADLGYGLAWYDDWIAPSRPCAAVSNSPLAPANFGLIQVDRSAYRQYLFFGPEQPLYLYGSLAYDCPRLPAASGAPIPDAGVLRSAVAPGGYTSAIVRNGAAAHGGGS